jgi:hypothetical protein
VAIVKERAEERRWRRDPTASLRQRQRRMLVPQQLRQQPMCLPNALFHTLLPHSDPDRQGIDQHPHHMVDTLSSIHAAKQDRPEDHILSPG